MGFFKNAGRADNCCEECKATPCEPCAAINGTCYYPSIDADETGNHIVYPPEDLPETMHFSQFGDPLDADIARIADTYEYPLPVDFYTGIYRMLPGGFTWLASDTNVPTSDFVLFPTNIDFGCLVNIFNGNVPNPQSFRITDLFPSSFSADFGTGVTAIMVVSQVGETVLGVNVPDGVKHWIGVTDEGSTALLYYRYIIGQSDRKMWWLKSHFVGADAIALAIIDYHETKNLLASVPTNNSEPVGSMGVFETNVITPILT